MYVHELWNHTPLMQEGMPENLDEPARHGLLMDPRIHLESIDIARSYRNAADLLWQNAFDSGLPVLEAYPVLYAYRHALELYLKMLGNTGREVQHNLKNCLKAVEALHADRLHNRQFPPRLRKWITILHWLDEDGCNFRYAPESSSTMDEKWLDWEHFHYAMGEIFNALENAWLRINKDPTLSQN